MPAHPPLSRPLVLFLALGLAACGGGESGGGNAGGGLGQLSSRPGSEFSPVIATVGDIDITRDYFDYRHAQLPPQEKARYSGEGWEQRFLDTLVEETLMVQAARDAKEHRDPETEMRLDMAARSVLLKTYYDRRFIEELGVPEAEVRDYYESNQETFVSLGRMRASHIQTSTRQKADAAWAELQAGEPFSTVAHRYSENEATRANDGSTGWFNPDGYVLGLGFDKEFNDFAFSLEEGTTAPPRKFGDFWHIVRAGSKISGDPQPLEKVRDRIESTLRPVLAREAYRAHIAELTGEFGVRREGEFRRETRDADQLFKMGVETTNPHARLDHFGVLVKNFPDHERADDALFMIGFIQSEDFGDEPMARVAFRQLLRDFPDSPYAADAEFMMGNLGRKVPQIRGKATPRTPDDISDRIGAVRGSSGGSEGGQ